MSIDEKEIHDAVAKCFIKEFFTPDGTRCEDGPVELITKMRFINENERAVHLLPLGARKRMMNESFSKNDFDLLRHQDSEIQSFIDEVADIIYRHKVNSADESNITMGSFEDEWREYCRSWGIPKRTENQIVKLAMEGLKKSEKNEVKSRHSITMDESLVIQDLLERYEMANLFPGHQLFDGISARKKMGNLAMILTSVDFFRQKSADQTARKTYEVMKNRIRSLDSFLRSTQV